MTGDRWGAVAVMTGALALCAGCARPPDGNGAAQVVACVERSGPISSDVRARDLAGSYRLTLVATTGDSTGTRAEGKLTLAPNDSAHSVVRGVGTDAPRPNVATPLYGWTDLAARTVGAVNTGSLRASDPDRPGVLVIEGRPQGAEVKSDIVLRLGEYSNDRDRVLFDGGYTVLRVAWIDGGAFGGSWESAAMNRGSAGGYFCAQPTP